MSEGKVLQFNIFPFVVEALGYNRSLYAAIDKLYQTDKLTFYNLAKNHDLYNHPIMKEGGLLQEEYSKKALGILLKAETDEKVHLAISSLFIMGWKSVYTFVENKSSLDLEVFLKYLLKKHNGIENITDDSLNTTILIAYVMALSLDKKVVENDFYSTFVNSLRGRWGFYCDHEYRISLSRMSEEDKRKVIELKKKLGFYDIISLAMKNKELSEVPAFLFDFENLSSVSIFDDIAFTSQDLDEILYLCVLLEMEFEHFSSLELCVSFYMHLRYMIKAYKQVKEHYFLNNKETMFFEFDNLETEKKAVEERLASTLLLLNNAYAALDQLKREVKRLKQEVLLSESEKKELHALREFVFTFDEDHKEEYQPVVSRAVDLSKVKGVVLGGHERWQAKMKELLPEFSFIPADSLNFDTALIENADYLFISRRSLNHAIYYRAVAAMSRVKVHFLQHVNEELVLEEIKNAVV